MREYKIGLYEKAMPGDISWTEKLMAAKEAGYDYLEMSIDATEEKINRIYMSKQERQELVALMNEIGVPVLSMCVSALTKYALGDPDDAIEARALEIALKSIELAKDIGVLLVMIPGYDIYYGESTAETTKKFEKNIRKVADAAAAAGIRIGFETMENSFMNTVEKAMLYVALTDSYVVQVYPDLGNITNAAVLYHHDVLEDLERGQGCLAAMHLKETKPGIFREVPYGEGHVDFEAGIKKAWELGVRRFVTEFWYEGNPEWKKELCEVCALFRKRIDKAAKS